MKPEGLRRGARPREGLSLQLRNEQPRPLAVLPEFLAGWVRPCPSALPAPEV